MIVIAQVPLGHQYLGLAVLSGPMFFFAGAGPAIFWVIAASFIVVMCHASFYAIEAVLGDEEAPFDLQMEEVTLLVYFIFLGNAIGELYMEDVTLLVYFIWRR